MIEMRRWAFFAVVLFSNVVAALVAAAVQRRLG